MWWSRRDTHGRDSRAAVAVRAAARRGYKLASRRQALGGMLRAQPGCSPCSNVGDAPFPFTRLGWGALLEARALTAAGLEPRRMALARPAPLEATKARDVEPERALCKPTADAASASGPRLNAVVSGRSPISHDLDVQSQQPSPAQRVCGSVFVFVFCATSLRLPPHACRCPNRVQRNGQPLCSLRSTTTNGVRCGLAQTPVIRSRRVALPLRPARNQRRSLQPAVETT